MRKGFSENQCAFYNPPFNHVCFDSNVLHRFRSSRSLFSLSCNTARWNSVLSASRVHGRLVPAATDRRYREQGTPNGTGGISSILEDHLGSGAIQPSRGGGRRTTSQGHGVCYGGIRIVYTVHIGGKLGCECRVFIQGVHTTCASRSSLFIIVAKKNIVDSRGRSSSVCAANTTEAPVICYGLYFRFLAASRFGQGVLVDRSAVFLFPPVFGRASLQPNSVLQLIYSSRHLPNPCPLQTNAREGRLIRKSPHHTLENVNRI